MEDKSHSKDNVVREIKVDEIISFRTSDEGIDFDNYNNISLSGDGIIDTQKEVDAEVVGAVNIGDSIFKYEVAFDNSDDLSESIDCDGEDNGFSIYDEDDEDDDSKFTPRRMKSKRLASEVKTITSDIYDDKESFNKSKGIKIRSTALQSNSAKINKFDLVFIKIWAVIVTSVTYCANGINFLIGVIFNKKAPLKYVKAGVVILFIALMLVTLLVPVAVGSNNKANSGIDIFNSNLIPVLVETKDGEYNWGYIHKKYASDSMAKDALVIPAFYEEALPFSEQNVAWVRVKNGEDDYWELIDTKGRRVGERTYDVMAGVKPVGEFSDNNMCWINISGKYGYINSKGDIKIDPTYDNAETFVDGIASVGHGSKQWYISTSGKTIGRYNEYDEIYSFSDGLGAVYKGKWGFVDEKGREIIEMQYDNVTPFINGLAMVNMGANFGIIDKVGNKVVSYIEYNDVYVDNDIFRAFIKEHSEMPR